MPISPHIGTARALLNRLTRSTGYVSSGVNYLLGPFRFTTDESAPMVSPHVESGAVGALTLVQVDGQFSASGGELVGAAPVGNVWNSSGWYAPGNVRAAGVALIQTFYRTGGGIAQEMMVAVWATSQTVNFGGFASMEHGYYNSTGNLAAVVSGIAVSSVAGTSQDVAYQYAVVLRSAGAFYLVKGGVYSEWTLLYVIDTGSTATLYPAFGSRSGSSKHDNIRVTTLAAPWTDDYGIALSRSTFTAADSTALTAIVPEIGGAWTARNGTFDVQSNRASITGSDPGGPSWVATVASSTADVIVESTVRIASGSQTSGIVVRYSDNNNFWLIYVSPDASEFAIYERNAGTWTARATASVTINTNTDYRIVAIVEGSTITAFLNNGNRISYSSATLNQSATTHGFRLASVAIPGPTIDNFVVYPRTLSGAALAALNGV